VIRFAGFSWRHALSRTSVVARLVGVSTVAVALASYALPGPAGASPTGHSLRADLVSRAGGHASFVPAHDTAGVFFGTDRGHAATRPAGIGRDDSPAAAASSWMGRYGAAFGVHDAAHSLRVERSLPMPGGNVVRMQQTVSGLPVVGGELSVVLDDNNRLVSTIGHVSSARTVSTKPAVSAATAKAVAVRAVAKRHRNAVQLTATEPVLSVLDQSVLSGPVLIGAVPVWATTVTSAGGTVRHSVYVEASRGVVALDLDDNPHASRTVCQPTSYNGSPNSEKIADPTCPPGPDTSTVASPGTSSDSDVFDAYTFAGAVDSFYLSLLKRNSLDGKGMALNSTVHFCDVNDPNPGDCPFPNAFWDGHEMVYGDGYARALDVVGHEMTHGVTEHTSNLLSYYQSGAINESESDVMGELIQQIEGPAYNATGQTDVYNPADAWKIGEDLSGGPFRYMDHPENDAHQDVNGNIVGDPDSMSSSAYDASPFYWDNGGVHENLGVGNKAAFLIAAGADGHGGGTFNGYTVTGVAGNGATTDPYSSGVTEDTVVKDVKTANIYYRLDKTMVSASTYADLYRLLPQACDGLVGASLAMPPLRANATAGWSKATTSITAADCAQVRQAVRATKMNVLPTKAGAAIPTPSPYCTNGGSATGRRTDTFETNPFSAGSYKRTRNTATTKAVYGYPTSEIGSWWWTKNFQTAGSAASIWGEDIDPLFASPDLNSPTYSYEDARVRKVAAVKAARGTYVWFRTAWNFESSPVVPGGTTYNFDGGTVEYSVDGGSTWRDAGALFVNNGYNGRISNTDHLFDAKNYTYIDPNPLKGHRGFVRDSRGWTASRLDLSSLKGKAVVLRWRVAADDQGSAFGWFVDNVTSYSCNPTHVSISAPAKVAKGKAAVVKAHVTRAGTATSLGGLPVRLWERRHGTTTWVRVGTKTTNKFGNVRWSRTHTTAEDYRVRMIGKKPFAPSNYATTTVRLS
jgi:bacillolysin